MQYARKQCIVAVQLHISCRWPPQYAVGLVLAPGENRCWPIKMNSPSYSPGYLTRPLTRSTLVDHILTATPRLRACAQPGIRFAKEFSYSSRTRRLKAQIRFS